MSWITEHRLRVALGGTVLFLVGFAVMVLARSLWSIAPMIVGVTIVVIAAHAGNPPDSGADPGVYGP